VLFAVWQVGAPVTEAQKAELIRLIMQRRMASSGLAVFVDAVTLRALIDQALKFKVSES